jgi:hypothetical protein
MTLGALATETPRGQRAEEVHHLLPESLHLWSRRHAAAACACVRWVDGGVVQGDPDRVEHSLIVAQLLPQQLTLR